MKLIDALGLGPFDGKTVIPVSVWLPVLVVCSVLAAVLLTGLDGESALVQLAVAGVTGFLVVAVATALARWRNPR